MIKVKLVLRLNTVELVLRMKPRTTQAGSNQWLGETEVSARLSERYEFSEAYLAVVGDSGGVQGEGAMDYEVPLQSGEHDEYSHLRH